MNCVKNYAPIILWVLTIALPAFGSENTRPNIVLFLADDLGWNDVGYHNPTVETPNIDAIASAGIELGRFYVNASCSPTRASLLTGQWATSHGVTFPVHKDMPKGLPLENKLLPEYLKDAGYQTHLVGKWHLGLKHRAYTPLARGFDTFYGFLGGGIGYYDHVFSGGLDWQRNGVTLVEDGYSTELIAQESIRLVSTRDPDRPFFLFVSFNAPHVPLQAPGGASETHDGRDTLVRMIESMDTAVGGIVEVLRKEQILDNTLVVFLSDNGGQINLPFLVTYFIPQLKDGYADNSPLRAGKGRIFEGGVRVPAAIWWPDKIESEKPSLQPMHVADILPTLAEAAGVSLQDVEFDGVSQWPSLQTNVPQERQPFVVVGGASEALIDWPWKLVKEASAPFIPRPFRTVSYELYQIDNDPSETTDVATLYPMEFQRLKLQLNALPRKSVTSWASGEGEDIFGGEIVRSPWAEAVIE